MFPLLIPSLCLVLLQSGPQGRKISAPFPRLAGQVERHWFGPLGGRCFFLANPELEQHVLYSVDLDGPGAPVPLSASLPPPSSSGVRCSADEKLVVFWAGGDLYRTTSDGRSGPELVAGPSLGGPEVKYYDFELDRQATRVVFTSNSYPEPSRLYSVSLASGASPVLLAGPGQARIGVQPFEISPKGNRVAFIADLEQSDVRELYCVPIDGSAAPVKLSGPLGRHGDVQRHRFTPDGTRIVFQADPQRDEDTELFIVPADGSAAPTRISGAPLARAAALYDFVLAGGRIVFRADRTTNELYELYSAPLDASSEPVRLSAPLAPGGDVHCFRLAPDGNSVVYLAGLIAGQVLELGWVPCDGSAPAVRLDGPPPDWIGLGEFRIAPDGRSVVYRGEDPPGTVELYSVSLAAGAPAVRLTSSAASGGVDESFEISADGRRAVYRTRPDYPAFFELQSVELGASSAPVVLGRMSQELFYSDAGFALDPDGRSVLYRSDQAVQGVVELFSAPLDGGAQSERLSPSPFPGHLVGDAEVVGFGADERVVYKVSTGADLYSVPHELWSVSARGPARTLRLFSDPLHEEIYPTLDPGGRFAVLHGIHMDGLVTDLWSVALDGHRPPALLSDPGVNVGPFGVPAQGPALAFCDRNEQISAVSMDASTAARMLTDPLGPTIGVEELRVDARGSRVVYRGYDGTLRAYGIYSLPMDGSSASVKLSGTQVRGGSPGEFVLGANERVVYLADQEVDQQYELFSAPFDGASGPVKLSGELDALGDVGGGFCLTPSGGRVVYRADVAGSGLAGLYSVPSDGSASPVELQRALVPGAETLREFRVTPDGRHVVFLADPERDGSLELFSVPVRGRATPRRISGPLAPGHGVQPDFQFSGDGRTVVFRADREVQGRFRLFSVVIRSLRGPTELSAGPSSFTDVQSGFALGPDDRLVVFAADARSAGIIELFEAPVAGGALPRPLHPPFRSHADIQTEGRGFAISPDSRQVVYSADADVDEVFELYASELTPDAVGVPVLRR